MGKLPAYMVDVGDPEIEKNKFQVDVGTPQIESPQYSVEVGMPHIDAPHSSPALLAMQQIAQQKQQSNDDNIRSHIAAKLTRAPVLGHVADSNLLSMAELGKVGIQSDPNKEGIPYGLDLAQLNGLERSWLQKRAK